MIEKILEVSKEILELEKEKDSIDTKINEAKARLEYLTVGALNGHGLNGSKKKKADAKTKKRNVVRTNGAGRGLTPTGMRSRSRTPEERQMDQLMAIAQVKEKGLTVTHAVNAYGATRKKAAKRSLTTLENQGKIKKTKIMVTSTTGKNVPSERYVAM